MATALIETKQDERGRRITRAAERETMVQAYEESGLTHVCKRLTGDPL